MQGKHNGRWQPRSRSTYTPCHLEDDLGVRVEETAFVHKGVGIGRVVCDRAVVKPAPLPVSIEVLERKGRRMCCARVKETSTE